MIVKFVGVEKNQLNTTNLTFYGNRI